MPEEAIIQPTPELSPDLKVAPNLESELDSALGKMFSTPVATPKPNENKPIAEVKVEDKKTVVNAENKSDKNQLPPTPAANDQAPEKTKDGWSVLKTNYKKAQQLAQERDDEIKKLKGTLAEKGSLTEKEVSELKSQIQDLSKYRAMIDIQSDPEFISKYDQPIGKSVSSIKEMLLGLNVSKEIVDQIDFSNTKLMDQIIGHVGEHQDKFIARKLQRKVEELIELSDKRTETLSTQKEKYNEFLESKKKESFAKDAEGEGRLLKHLESVALGKDREGNQKYPPIPFLNRMTPNEGASQPEIDQINNHNKMVDLMGQKLQEIVKMTTPEDKAEMAIAAVASHYLSAQLKAAQGRIQSLEEELKKISTVSDETVKAKSPASRRNGNSLDLDSAMAAHFAATR